MDLQIPEVVYTWQFWCAAVLCYVVCEAVKRIPNIPAWTINIVNLFAGAVIYVLLVGGWADPANYLFGILAASLADIAYQLFKNIVHSVLPMDEIKIGGSE